MAGWGRIRGRIRGRGERMRAVKGLFVLIVLFQIETEYHEASILVGSRAFT